MLSYLASTLRSELPRILCGMGRKEEDFQIGKSRSIFLGALEKAQDGGEEEEAASKLETFHKPESKLITADTVTWYARRKAPERRQ